MADINTITEIPGKKNSLESTLKYVIKNGLYCSIKKVFIEQENSSFLIRDSEKVAMTFHFSESGCGLAFADMPVSYDMEIVFNLEYLKNFSSSDDFDWNLRGSEASGRHRRKQGHQGRSQLDLPADGIQRPGERRVDRLRYRSRQCDRQATRRQAGLAGVGV